MTKRNWRQWWSHWYYKNIWLSVEERRFYLALIIIVGLCIYPINYVIESTTEEPVQLKTMREYYDQCVELAKEQQLDSDMVTTVYNCMSIAHRACMVRGCRDTDGLEN